MEMYMVDRKKLGKANRRKGHDFERKVAKFISNHTGSDWRRTPYSGAGHISGDVFRLPTPFPYAIELKNRKDITLDKIFKNPDTIKQYVSSEQILIFNNKGQAIVIVNMEIMKKMPYTESGEFSPVTDLHIDGDWYLMLNLKDFCDLLKEGR